MEQALGLSMNSINKYNYQASESAPMYYPMQIISGALYYQDGSGSLYIPNMAVVANGWGDDNSSHVLDNDGYPLPNKLKTIFYSFTEKQFYQGEFELPVNKIQELFDNGYQSLRADKVLTYDKFIVGVAPGGGVAIWLSSMDRRVEVFFGKAEKIEGDWKWITDNQEVDPDEYIQEIIEYERRTPEQLDIYNKEGVPFGVWEKYHERRYAWKPALTEMKLRDNIINNIVFYNGEVNFQGMNVNTETNETFAVPSEIDIIWNRTGYLVNDLKIECFFDEDEIFTAFEKIAKDNKPIFMEFRMQPENNYDFTIWLRSDKSSIELKKTRIKTWKPGGMRYENAGPKDMD